MSDFGIDDINKATEQPTSSGKLHIPAKDKVNIFAKDRILRVCAYCRVSTDSEDQQSSYELQKEHYMRLASSHSNWEFTVDDIYADEGISGTSTKHRKSFREMIEKCKRGDYNLILTKSVSRFARNLLDCISLIRELKNQDPPVGVFFETDNLNTLSEESEMKLSIFAMFAQEESVKKSESMIWSLQERFKNGKLLTPEPYGYRRPRDIVGNYIKYGKLEIEESEAVVVRFIFDAFLAGFSVDRIAELLTEIDIPTKFGKPWNGGSIVYMLKNERYCGNVLTWKTFTADLFEHKKRKNNHDKDQYLYTDHHPAIISVEKFEAVQAMFVDKRHGMKGGYNVMQVIDNGIFQGFVPINHHWVNDDPDKYFQASDSAPESDGIRHIKRSSFSSFDLTGYQVVRGLFLTKRSELPCLTFYKEKIFFNVNCGRKLCTFDHIQLLLHPYKRQLAIRPCASTDTFAIPWSRFGKETLIKTLNCQHFIQALSQIMEWNPDMSYKVIGTWVEKCNDRLMIFNLDKAAPMIKTEVGENGRVRNVVTCPDEWISSFGDEFYQFCLDNELFYTRDTKAWNSQATCRAAEQFPQLSLLSHTDILDSLNDIKISRVGEV